MNLGYGNMPQAPFNMAALWFLELDRLQLLKYEAIVKRDAETYFCVVDCIFTHCFMKIPKDKRDKVREHLSKVYKKVIADYRSSDRTNDFNKLKGFEMCKELDRDLVLILHDAKLFFPDINFNFGFDRIREDLGLNGRKKESSA